MKEMKFIKISATGNDFIVIDNRENTFNAEDLCYLWIKICKRRTGIGADGVLLLEKSEKLDFKMRYINADGNEVDMCGNGARAISKFASVLINSKNQNEYQYKFETKNGIYHSVVSAAPSNFVKVSMSELYDIGKIRVEDFFSEDDNILSATYMNTGVPHVVFEVADVSIVPIDIYGKQVRYDPRFEGGTNVDFVQKIDGGTLKVRTYERGVEGETLSCGTGVVASAVFNYLADRPFNSKRVIVEGGELKVEIIKDPLSLDAPRENIILGGNVEIIFKGQFYF